MRKFFLTAIFLILVSGCENQPNNSETTWYFKVPNGLKTQAKAFPTKESCEKARKYQHTLSGCLEGQPPAPGY